MTNPEIRADDIIDAAAQYFDIRARQITGPYQSYRVVQARHACVYLMRDMTDMTYAEIGDALGGQHHTTALTARKKVVAMLDSTNPDFDPLMRDRVENVAVLAQKLRLQRNENNNVK